MAAWLDVCRYLPTLGGTTDWTFSAAVTGYASPALAGVVNTRVYKYRAESGDLSQWELGEGAYNTGTGVLARTTVLYNSSGTGTATGQSGAGTKISFSSVPQVAIVALKEDLISIEEANAFTTTQKDQARTNIGADQAAKGSSRVLLQSQTVSGVASVTFSSTFITSTYDSYVVEIHSLLPATNTVSLFLTVSDDNGSTYKSTAYQWARQLFHSGSTTISGGVNAAAANIAIVDGVADNNVGRALSGSITFLAPAAAASRLVNFNGDMSALSAALGGTFVFRQLTIGQYTNALAGILNNIKLAMSSGNLSGTFSLYGIKTS